MQSIIALVLIAVTAVNGQSSSNAASSRSAIGKGSNPSGVPFPDTVYPGFESPNPQVAEGAKANQTSPPYYPSPWGDGSGGWEAAYEKARAFVSQLTLLEKVNLTTGVSWEGELCVGQNGAIPRLGFRSMCMQDSPLGVRFADLVSAFPAGINVAATWSRGHALQRGAAMGAEHRDKGVDVQLGPVAGPLGRSPQGGRNWEGFSPDPYLTGLLMADTVRGIQSSGVIACSKHYIMNEQEHFRQAQQAPFGNVQAYSSNIDDVTMHETYLWPFADAIRAGTGSIMCSYNQINNSYGCQNSYTLNYLLKGELGFQGYVMSDWQAQSSGVSSALAGLDQTMPGDTTFDSGLSYWGPNLTIAVLNGTIPQWRLDDMAIRIIAAWYFVGRDKTQVPINFDSWSTDTYSYLHAIAMEGYGVVNQHLDVRGDHANLIRQIGAASVVLLKNTHNALPLKGNEKLTGVFGEDAGSNINGPNGCGDRGCDNGTLAMGWGSGTANFPYLVTPDTAIENEVIGQGGSYESILNNYAASQISVLASRASVALVFVNADAGEGYIEVDNNQGDRNNLTLWKDGDALVKAVASLCNNTIVVIHSVGAVILEDIKNNPNVTGILWAGLPGQESGNSIADVLYGKVNPGAKLPFTIAANRSEYGSDLLYTLNGAIPQIQYTEGNFIDYRAFDRSNKTPTYEFGFGLSYTNFSYSNIAVTKHQVGPYIPTAGQTKAAPTYGSISNNEADYTFPADFHRVKLYIYPNINSTDLRKASQDPQYDVGGATPPGSQDGSAQSRIAAGGAPGGNPQLWDVLYTVTATITNTGRVGGEEVPQLYVSLGGPYDPVKVLRGFERLSIQAGQSTTFTADITRRDISNWDSESQNWIVSKYPKTAYIGSSSKNLPLSIQMA